MPSLDASEEFYSKTQEIKNKTTKETERKKLLRSDVMCGENCFDKLPDEILLLIFENLEREELKSLTKVCWRFKRILLTSSLFIRSSKLKITADLRLHDGLDFPYSRISIHQAWKNHVRKRSMRIAVNQKENIREMKIERGEVNFNLKILSVVSENLTTLKLRYVDKKLDFPHDKIKLDFPNLKVFEVIYASLALRHIGGHKIEEMFIRDDVEKLLEFNKFLETCGGLRRLKLENILPTYDPQVHTYKLDSLTYSNDEEENQLRVRNFLRPHRETLKSIKIPYPSHEAVKYAIRKTNVDELFCHTTNFETDETLKPNKSIKKLRVRFSRHHNYPAQNVHKIIEACKSVETLRVDCDIDYFLSRADFKIISQNMKSLRHLILPRMTTFIHSMTFDKVETLQIRMVYTKDEHKSWISLAMCCPNIKRVFVTQKLMYTEDSEYSLMPMALPSSDLKSLLKSCKNLQELHIGPFFDITDEFVETFNESESKSFWYLRVASRDFEEDAEKAKIFKGSKVRCEVVRNYASDDSDED